MIKEKVIFYCFIFVNLKHHLVCFSSACRLEFIDHSFLCFSRIFVPAFIIIKLWLLTLLRFVFGKSPNSNETLPICALVLGAGSYLICFVFGVLFSICFHMGIMFHILLLVCVLICIVLVFDLQAFLGSRSQWCKITVILYWIQNILQLCKTYYSVKSHCI